MADRMSALASLAAGDIFHAQANDGASLVCLVTSVTDVAINARTVTTQYCLSFDRQAGIANWGDGICFIDSMAPLPAEILDVLLGLDQRYRLGVSCPKLSASEIQALLFVGPFFRSQPA